MTSGLSLKATQADSFYYPPEWEPRRGNLDSFQRKRGFEHHLGKSRVKNIDKGVLVIRFEVPFHVRCIKCEKRIAQGTRFDADKKAVGKYHTTKILEFTMHCKHLSMTGDTAYCDQKLVFRTDPENSDYTLVEGMTKCVDTFDAKDAETIELLDDDTRRKMKVDPMFRLEHTEAGDVKEKEKVRNHHIRDLVDLQDSRWDDNYSANRALRQRFRIRKAEQIAAEEEARQPKNFAMPLLEKDEADLVEANTVRFKTDQDRIQRSMNRVKVMQQPLFRTAGAVRKADQRAELLAKRRKLAMHQRMEAAFK